MEQEVKYLPIKDLILWSENPRDPLDEKSNNQAIVDLALNDRNQRWEIEKLAKQMGETYDLSELPTVVYHGQKPVVYDGNRRVIIAMLSLGLAKNNSGITISKINAPEKLPCNVCDKKIALKNIYRKHGDSGSWKPLERDIFLNKHLHEPKSAFLMLEEATGVISRNPHLNQRFVKEEIFDEETLGKIGFTVTDDKIKTKHTKKESLAVLEDVSEKVKDKEITTRKKRGKIEEVLNKETLDIIDKNKNNSQVALDIANDAAGSGKGKGEGSRQAHKNKQPKMFIFGGKLYIKKSGANDLYRDIFELYSYYLSNRHSVSASFTNIIRMALRLLAEVAASEKQSKMDSYIRDHFDDAKAKLSKDEKTFMSTNTVTKENIVQLLQTGAHGYSSSANPDQTVAISLVLGKMVELTHPQVKP